VKPVGLIKAKITLVALKKILRMKSLGAWSPVLVIMPRNQSLKGGRCGDIAPWMKPSGLLPRSPQQ
jgi:hypothetical protein